jgi:hypothetical protein
VNSSFNRVVSPDGIKRSDELGDYRARQGFVRRLENFISDARGQSRMRWDHRHSAYTILQNVRTYWWNND